MRSSKDGTSNEDVDIDVEGVSTGDVGIGEGPAVEMAAVAEAPIVDVISGDAGAIKAVIDANFYQLTACYEQFLRQDQGLQGRVELEWSVASGGAHDVYVSSNNTGNRGFGECLVRKVQRWRFPRGAEVDLAQAWVFRQK